MFNISSKCVRTLGARGRVTGCSESGSSCKKLLIARLSDIVNFAFIEAKTGNKIHVEGTVGKTVLDTALQYDVDIEGACGGELACSTCHVVVPKELYDRLPPKKVEEDDMLDLAWGLTPT